MRSVISSKCERVTKAVLFLTPLHPKSPLCFFTHSKLENIHKLNFLGNASNCLQEFGLAAFQLADCAQRTAKRKQDKERWKT